MCIRDSGYKVWTRLTKQQSKIFLAFCYYVPLQQNVVIKELKHSKAIPLKTTGIHIIKMEPFDSTHYLIINNAVSYTHLDVYKRQVIGIFKTA